MLYRHSANATVLKEARRLTYLKRLATLEVRHLTQCKAVAEEAGLHSLAKRYERDLQVHQTSLEGVTLHLERLQAANN